MILTAPHPLVALDHAALLASVPPLVGHVPRESVVLVPVRNGSPTGALRFDLATRNPGQTARAWIGALGRFGKADAAMVVLYAERRRDPAVDELIAALCSRARAIGLVIEVLVAPGRTTEERRGPTGIEAVVDPLAGLLPFVEREEALAVSAEVDALLDRHPSARIPEPLVASVDAVLARAAAGRPWQPRPRTTAALIVCAQRPQWFAHAAGVITSIASGPDLPVVTALLARAAASAPATERVPVLVVLATLHWRSGRRDCAAALAQQAARADPHDLGARLLLAALERGDECPWPVVERRAA